MAASLPHHYFFDSSAFCTQEISNISSNGVPLLITSPLSLPEPPFTLHSNRILVPQLDSGYSGSGYNQEQVFEPGDGFMVCPPYTFPMPAKDWATTWTKEEDSNPVGRYSVEEKKVRILRYLKKRNQRNFNKTIKYACRKTLADKRVRVRGRFAKNSEPSQDQILMNTTHDHNQVMMKYEEDYWLEASIENLGQLPYLGSFQQP